jgi:hypothetical protein
MWSYKPGRNPNHPGDPPPKWAPLSKWARLALLVTVIAGIVIAFLILATRTAGGADGVGERATPDPPPPPWFGGRVELPRYGLALTVPDGWVAVDLTADIDGQAALLASRVQQDLEACASDLCAAMRRVMGRERIESSVTEALLEARATSIVWLGDLAWADLSAWEPGAEARVQDCRVGMELPASDLAPDDLPNVIGDVITILDADPQLELIGEWRELSIDGHAAASFDLLDSGSGPDSDLASRSTWYLLSGEDGRYRWLTCRGASWPDDRWLSIAWTLEFLPEVVTSGPTRPTGT